MAWGDYDNDGDLDILLTGYPGSLPAFAAIYRNDGGSFTDIEAGLQGVYFSSVAWGDYDNDGDLDILMAGSISAPERFSAIYRNDGGTFTDIDAGLAAVSDSSVAWGDYDNDGDLDALLTGYTGSTAIARVYRNDGGSFTDIGANLTGVSNGSVAWGDYDNDGDLDLLLTGGATAGEFAKIYRNEDCPELEIEKWAEPQTDVDYHGVVTYTVVLSNTGGTGTGVRLTDTLPAQVEFGRWVESNGANETGGQITWTGTVTAGHPITWTWQVTHTGGYGEVVTNTAWYGYGSEVSGYTATFQVVDRLQVTSTDPDANAVGADPATGITATFDANVDASTVTTRTFTAQGMMGGLLSGTYDTNGDTVTFDPTSRNLFAGEIVRTSLTGDIRGTGREALVPYQWQFTAGPVFERCAGEFVDIDAGLTGTHFGSTAWADYDGDGDLDVLLTG